MRDMVEVRESYFKQADGTYRVRQQIGNHVLWEGPSPVVFISWSAADLPRNLIRKPATALVKEGPKAIVKWRGPCTTL